MKQCLHLMTAYTNKADLAFATHRHSSAAVRMDNTHHRGMDA